MVQLFQNIVSALSVTPTCPRCKRPISSEDVNVAKGMISTSSPIGRGLLGKQVGDSVKIQIPDGTREMEIVELITIHQAGS